MSRPQAAEGLDTLVATAHHPRCASRGVPPGPVTRVLWLAERPRRSGGLTREIPLTDVPATGPSSFLSSIPGTMSLSSQVSARPRRALPASRRGARWGASFAKARRASRFWRRSSADARLSPTATMREASVASARRMCSMSYLGIPQCGEATASLCRISPISGYCVFSSLFTAVVGDDNFSLGRVSIFHPCVSRQSRTLLRARKTLCRIAFVFSGFSCARAICS